MRAHSNWGPTSVLSQRERKLEDIGLDEDAGVAGQTALSGSQIKPPLCRRYMTWLKNQR